MDFYRETAIEDWTCVNLAEHYHAWSGKKDLKVVMDYMKKDLQKVADYESEFEVMRKIKAREILDNWRRKLGLLVSSDELLNWTTSINNLKQDCARVNVGNLRVKQVNQLATGNVATYNDNRIIPGKHRRDANDVEKMNIEEATTLAKKDEHKEPPIKRTKIDDFFPVHDGIVSKDMTNDCHTDDDVVKSAPSSEEELAPPCPKSGISIEKSWDSFMIDGVDVSKCFTSLRQCLLKKSPEVHPPYWGVLDLTGQHKPTKEMYLRKWNYLINDFRVDVGWKMIGLDQSELCFFDNMEDLGVRQTLPILNAHLTILKSYLEHLKLPLNEGELMIRFVAPVFNMSLDPNQEKFRKLWSEQQLIASQERRRESQDPNNERARAGQKTDIIIDLPTGPALEGFICEVSGGLPAGCPKKIWTDKLKLMVGMRDMINRIIKTFPGLPSTDYMKVVVFGCQVIGLQMNLYAMDVRTPGIYRFGIVDKASLPASAKELPTYEAVHVMLRSLEHRLSNLTDYCTALKIKHAKLRRKRDYMYQEDSLAFSNNTPNSSPKLPSIRPHLFASCTNP
ncbi:3942_t:CDS:10 [Funneliformis mosseae]|uniref:3942_t:CDS:1 n=1 Tax=Funneliformis mosseae TaxID=27381 RepID=A0A9N9FZZ5_FUNMO|nr:3942_t:CDS:10 [Funneliformis mosseae]